ncbi:MAG TPA: DUF6263 family protein [Gemmataceae bacterium]|nr:DUF6263 family protein [Gemmataceae bacterium]
MSAFRRLTLIALAGSFALLPAVAEPPGKRVALVVGVNEYDNRKLDNLKYAERDAADLAQVLRDGGFVVRTLLGSKDGDDAATRVNVDATVAGLLKGLSKKDTVLIAFSGHGEQLFVTEGRERKEVPFFCPKDAVPTDPVSLVSLNGVLKSIDEHGGGHNLLLVDACRTVVDLNKGVRGGVNGTRIDALGEGTAVFFSCSGRQFSRETDKAGGGHGVFFHFVLEGLKGGAADDRGQVTWERLVPYVRGKIRYVSPDWFPGLAADDQQRPHVISNLPDDPILLTVSNSTAASSPESSAVPRGDLIWKFDRDKPLYSTMSTATQQTIKVMGSEIKLQQDLTFYMSWRFKAEDRDKSTVLSQKIEGVRFNITDVGNKKTVYDSTAPNSGTDPLASFISGLVGSEFTVAVDKNMKLVKIECGDEFVKKLSNADPSMQPLLKSILGEDSLKSLVDPTFNVAPPRPVAKHDTWTREAAVNDGLIGSFHTARKYTYVGQDDFNPDLARISISSKTDYRPPLPGTAKDAPWRIKSANLRIHDSPGVVLFDVKRGRPVEIEMMMTVKGNLDVEIGGQTTTVELNQTQVTTSTISDTSPIK